MWRITKILFLVLVGSVLVWLAFEIFTFPRISALRTENPTTTSMIEHRIDQAREENREPRKYMIWAPIEQISPEDEWIPPLPRFGRGASTVTQQLAKNLYLSEDRNFLRKGREALYTFFLERELSKKRILELYLNVIEWGDGIYGAEAASRVYFSKSASSLSPAESAYLAAMIPSPLNVFNPQKNPRRLKRRQRVIHKYMNSMQLRY
ncbi:MAG: transglycosylase domain-containing protein [Acidobacteria bacterium]|nr:transglycosylase domain-containing protein [Acidobacteriota bacterium]